MSRKSPSDENKIIDLESYKSKDEIEEFKSGDIFNLYNTDSNHICTGIIDRIFLRGERTIIDFRYLSNKNDVHDYLQVGSSYSVAVNGDMYNFKIKHI